MKWSTATAAAALAVCAYAAPASAQVVNELNFQGKLTDSSGNPRTTAVTIVFRIFGTATGGTALWTETRSVTPNANGVYSVALGSVTPFPGSLTFNQTLFLELQVGADAAMTPRYQMTSAPYSLRAARLGNLTDAGLSTTATVTDANLGTLTAGSSSNADTLHTHGFANLSGTSNVAILNATQTFSGTNTISGTINVTDTWQIAGSGVNSSVSATALNTLTAGATSDAGTLHGHATLIGYTGTVANLNTLTVGATSNADSLHTHNLSALGGAVSDGQLSSNVALLNRNPQTFTGANTFNNSLSVGGANTFTVGTGATSLGGTLSVAAASTFNGNVSVAGTSTLTVGTGATTLGGSLSVTGSTTLAGSLVAGGVSNFNNTTNMNGGVRILEGGAPQVDYATLNAAPLAAARTITLPDANGTVITTGNLTSITGVGTVASGVWNGTAIGPAFGGTGLTAVATGDLLYGSAANTWSLLAMSATTGDVLTANAGGVPTWGSANAHIHFGQTWTGTATGGSGLAVTNSATTGVSNGIRGESASGSGYGVWGNNTATTGNAYGVYGTTGSAAGYAVFGDASTSGGVGVQGLGGAGDGVRGISTSNTGVAGVSTSYTGVIGASTSGLAGDFSTSTGSIGVQVNKSGLTSSGAFGYGMRLINSGGSTATNYGLSVETTRPASVGPMFGIYHDMTGTSADPDTVTGIYNLMRAGVSTSGGARYGVQNWIQGGTNDTSSAYGIYSVVGSTTNTNAAVAEGIHNEVRLNASRTAAFPCYGYYGSISFSPGATNTTQVYGLYSATTFTPSSPSAPDVFGVYCPVTTNASHTGWVWSGRFTNNAQSNVFPAIALGVVGDCEAGPGFFGYPQGRTGVLGYAWSAVDFQHTGGYFGARRDVTGASPVYGVYAYGQSFPAAASGGTVYGVYGASFTGVNFTGTAYAGYFQGNVTVTGTLSKGGGSFLIDHPLDPVNRILRHSFVESPEMMNIYKGRARLANGAATIALPDWFEALNHPETRQLSLTCVDGWSPLFRDGKIAGNRFTVRTTPAGNQEQEFDWVVYAVRNDKWARENPIIVEQDKGVGNSYVRGRSVHDAAPPEEHPRPPEK